MVIPICILLLCIGLTWGIARNALSKSVKKPISVNYHISRKCNYQCGFCYHTAKTSYVLPVEQAKQGLRLLKESGMRKLNFAGGEPLLPEYNAFLGELIRFSKEELHLESISIVSNGSKIKEEWFETFGKYIDILAISCDSFDEATNVEIGRGTGKHIQGLHKAREICNKFGIKFKINTVVCSYNFKEDMRAYIQELAPFRWKCFQVLALQGENSGEGSIRKVDPFLISKEQFQQFCTLHRSLPCFVPESNEDMRDSYLILDEYMRFLNCSNNSKEPTASILEVGVEQALKAASWDEKAFYRRGGKYEWRNNKPTCSTTIPEW